MEMTSWREDNFLERLMPHLRQKTDATREPCPAPELLCAFAEDRLDAPSRDALATHLGRCPACAELHRRLLSFGTTHVPVQESEWRNAEKRLGNWMNAFLHAQATHARLDAEAERIGTARGWGREWVSSWKIQWGVSVAAGLVLMAATVFFLRPGLRVPREGQSRAERAQPANQLAGTEPGGEKRESPTSNSVGTPGGSNAPVEMAESHHRRTYGAPLSQQAVPLKGERPQAPSPLNPAENVLSPSEAKHAPETDLPNQIQSEAGAALLIRVISVSHQPDGSFIFRAVLTQPVSGKGRGVLVSGTEIFGSGVLNQGQVSLSITDLEIQGRRYPQKGTAAGANARIPELGAGAQFVPGQQVELWFVSAASYELAQAPVRH